ncbi:Protein of unknown function [Pyronema omphalodes CBS 100304]|uniref:Uncharacterized protein n=1 Tax=Pyronema omphalodes (strain CBS 100304) TaxID=1076935 RepID=U4LM98_PYROM|nr:Protein of unknown function [Pyronema omphalodes CBS 100304]
MVRPSPNLHALALLISVIYALQLTPVNANNPRHTYDTLHYSTNDVGPPGQPQKISQKGIPSQESMHAAKIFFKPGLVGSSLIEAHFYLVL